MPELTHIEHIRKHCPTIDPNVIRSIGDDCAVINRGENYELVTTDMLVEGDHFRLDWATAEEIGSKCIEVNISDIAAMGGTPKYAFISLCLSGKEPENFVKEFYQGLARPKIDIIGGDITKGPNTVICITMIGEAKKEQCIYRNSAEYGDLICVSGELGGSWAGLEYLRKYHPDGFNQSIQNLPDFIQYCLKKHLKPISRIDLSKHIARYANSMIDISDGLGSEIHHIVEESTLTGEKIGAEIEQEKIPINSAVIEMGKHLSKNPYTWALSGGEDFELLFTITAKNLEKLISKIENRKSKIINQKISVVGKIPLHPPKGPTCLLKQSNEEITTLPGGYEHKV